MMNNHPDPAHVTELRELLDLMADFPDNDQRARYLLTSNFMADHAHAAADNAREGLARALRREGRSWQAVADRLGVTRQAAQQRYGG